MVSHQLATENHLNAVVSFLKARNIPHTAEVAFDDQWGKLWEVTVEDNHRAVLNLAVKSSIGYRIVASKWRKPTRA